MNRIDVLLVEYGQVRGEVARRAIVQSAIQLLVPVLVVALVAVYGWLGDREPLAQLAVPLVFTVLAWVHVGQDHSIINAATYLHRVVRPAVIAALPRGRPPTTSCSAGVGISVEAVGRNGQARSRSTAGSCGFWPGSVRPSASPVGPWPGSAGRSSGRRSVWPPSHWWSAMSWPQPVSSI